MRYDDLSTTEIRELNSEYDQKWKRKYIVKLQFVVRSKIRCKSLHVFKNIFYHITLVSLHKPALFLCLPQSREFL